MDSRPLGSYHAVLAEFVAAGDEKPLHVHDYAHFTLCVAGQIEVFDDGGKTLRLGPGDRIEFPAGRPHGLRALTAGALYLNLTSMRPSAHK